MGLRLSNRESAIRILVGIIIIGRIRDQSIEQKIQRKVKQAEDEVYRRAERGKTSGRYNPKSWPQKDKELREHMDPGMDEFKGNDVNIARGQKSAIG
jgi:hypothetical protein